MPKVAIEGALYYSTIRGDDGREIFSCREDYAKYTELINKYKNSYGFKLFCCVLLPNHLHMIIEPGNAGTVSEILHDLNSSYTKYFNSQHGRKGHLLQERNKIQIIEKKTYFAPLSAYLHLNPVALGLVKEIDSYPYSTYQLYVDKCTQENPFCSLGLENEIKEGIGLLKESTTFSNYSDFLKAVKEQDLEDFAKKMSNTYILGSDSFKERVEVLTTAKSNNIEPVQSNKKIPVAAFLGAAGFILLLSILTLTLYCRAQSLAKAVKIKEANIKIELSQQVNKEKENIKRNLEEKYRADQVSYKAMAKRLEIEKKHIAELEKKSEGR